MHFLKGFIVKFTFLSKKLTFLRVFFSDFLKMQKNAVFCCFSMFLITFFLGSNQVSPLQGPLWFFQKNGGFHQYSRRNPHAFYNYPFAIKAKKGQKRALFNSANCLTAVIIAKISIEMKVGFFVILQKKQGFLGTILPKFQKRPPPDAITWSLFLVIFWSHVQLAHISKNVHFLLRTYKDF